MKTLMPVLALSLVVGLSPVYADEPTGGLILGKIPTNEELFPKTVPQTEDTVVETTKKQETVPVISDPSNQNPVDEKTRRLAELLKEAVDIYGAELPYILGELNKRFGTSLVEMEKVQKEREKIQTEQKPVQKDQTVQKEQKPVQKDQTVQKEQKPVQKDQTVQTVREDSTRSRCDAFGGSVLATCQAAWRDYKAGHSVPLSRLYNLGPGTESLDNN
jgi:hypothetical protein